MLKLSGNVLVSFMSLFIFQKKFYSMSVYPSVLGCLSNIVIYCELIVKLFKLPINQSLVVKHFKYVNILILKSISV